MAITPRRRPWQRRLRMTLGVAVLVGAGLLSYGFPPSPVSVRAAPRTRATCDPERWWLCLPPTSPPPVASVSPCDVDCPASPTPSPIILVISPVPLGPPSPPTTPSYLIGRASPPPSAPADTGGSAGPPGWRAGPAERRHHRVHFPAAAFERPVN